MIVLTEKFFRLFESDCKIIVRLFPASAFNIKNVRRIKLNLNNTLLFDYLEYVKTNR